MSSRVSAVCLRLPAPLLAAALWYLSSQSKLPVEVPLFGFDKVAHFGAYALFAACAYLWFLPRAAFSRPRFAYWLSVSIAVLWGALDEVHQSFVPGRFASVWDLLADTLGALVGAWCMARLVIAARAFFTPKSSNKP